MLKSKHITVTFTLSHQYTYTLIAVFEKGKFTEEFTKCETKSIDIPYNIMKSVLLGKEAEQHDLQT